MALILLTKLVENVKEKFENVWITNKISLKFVAEGPINNIPALVQIMAWCRPSDKPLSEPMTDYQCIYVSLSLNELSALLIHQVS